MDTEASFSLDDEDDVSMSSTPNLTTDEISSFDLPCYLDVLHQCKDEAEDFESKISMKTCQDRRLMLVEELSTISMILRNLSFVTDNESVHNNNELGAHIGFCDYVFELIYSIATTPDSFIFARKRLCLLKDTLITLTNVAHVMELRNSKEALLILVLCLSFGSKLSEAEVSSGLTIPKYDPITNKYQLHGVDILSKILCGSESNKKLVGNLISGDEESLEVLHLVKLYTGTDDLKDGSFFMRIFGFLMSVIPLDLLHQGIEPFDERLPSCLESLLACLILVDYITPTTFNKNVALQILDASESIGHSLIHLSFVYAAIYVNNNFDTKIQHAYVSIKCSELINGLIKASMEYSLQNTPNLEELNALNRISKIFSNDNNIIGALMTPDIPQDIAVQAVESSNLMSKLKNLVK
ncbi:unnamed protein product [Ambrosiozyma monospora]|uniref:Unnamed protein product n=1 Tax=Ambrosiozyma monospora TaxID=43982 RepID=A0ACB5TCH8_AMBMO|nr:unnamed protein product [Ambrosiozyma monospora]